MHAIGGLHVSVMLVYLTMCTYKAEPIIFCIFVYRTVDLLCIGTISSQGIESMREPNTIPSKPMDFSVSCVGSEVPIDD